LFNANAYLKYSSAEDWSAPSAADRSTEAQLVHGANTYLDLFSDKVVERSWGIPCARLEGGIVNQEGRLAGFLARRHLGGGFIERRIRMILSGEKILPTPRWLRGLLMASAVLLLPPGLTLAQDADDDLDMVRQWLESGVNSAFLTQEQADIMLRAVQVAESSDQLHVVVGEPGEIYVTNRRFVSNGDGSQVEVFINGENAGQSFEQALEFARNHFDERVAAGELTQAEADAIIEDMRNATEQGLAGGDGSDYYDLLVETGQINGATGERRIRIIRQMENDFNAAGGNAAASEVIEFELVRTDEAPVEVEAD
jgi:hypothetical protein